MCFVFNASMFLLQMVLMEESGDKPTLVVDRDPEGLHNIVDSSHILEASHVREVSDTQTQYNYTKSAPAVCV